jgi:hypothetical protein
MSWRAAGSSSFRRERKPPGNLCYSSAFCFYDIARTKLPGVMGVDIFGQLSADHRRQRGLIEKITAPAMDDAGRLSAFEELCEELEAHAAAEEQTLYAELLSLSHEQIEQSVSEHDRVGEMVSQLRDLEPASPQWLSKFALLKQRVEHHLDAEETHLLPFARARIGRRAAKLLGDRFEQVKQQELSTWSASDPARRRVPDREAVSAYLLLDSPAPPAASVKERVRG